MTRSNRISSPPSVCRGFGERVVVAHVRVGDAVEEQVHLRDGPDAAVVLLAEQGEVPGVAAVLLDVLLGEDEHAARARARVVDAHALTGLDQADHHADDGAGRVELAALLAGRVGELADQVLVGGAQQVGELEVLVAQPVLGEVDDQVPELLVRDRGLADLAGEVDVLDDAFEGGVGLLQRRERFVEPVADVVVDLVAEVSPSAPSRGRRRTRCRSRGARPAAPPRPVSGPLPALRR